MKYNKSITKKISVVVTLIVCLLLSICSVGCNTRYIVTIHNISYGTCFIYTPKKGDKITMKMIYNDHRENFPNFTESMIENNVVTDENFYTDYDCLNKFVGNFNRDITLYFTIYSPTYSGKVIFEYKNKEYTVFRPRGNTLTAEDFTRSAYGYGKPEDYTFYSDKEHSSPLNIQNVEIPKDMFDSKGTKIYVADAK